MNLLTCFILVSVLVTEVAQCNQAYYGRNCYRQQAYAKATVRAFGLACNTGTLRSCGIEVLDRSNYQNAESGLPFYCGDRFP